MIGFSSAFASFALLFPKFIMRLPAPCAPWLLFKSTNKNTTATTPIMTGTNRRMIRFSPGTFFTCASIPFSRSSVSISRMSVAYKTLRDPSLKSTCTEPVGTSAFGVICAFTILPLSRSASIWPSVYV